MDEVIDRYTYRVFWSDKDEEYVGLCAEFGTLSYLDDTPERALIGIRELVSHAAPKFLYRCYNGYEYLFLTILMPKALTSNETILGTVDLPHPQGGAESNAKAGITADAERRLCPRSIQQCA